MSTINITIDGRQLTGAVGDTILTIASANGIEIPTLCHHEKVKLYGACGLCVVEADGIPKLLRACSTVATDGMVIHTDSPRVKQSRKIALELLMSDHEGDCIGPCKLNCPAGTSCQEYVKQIAVGNEHEAVRIIKEKLPLPSSIGRICPHPCETACRRKMVEEPISIAHLKYYASDVDLFSDNKYMPEISPATGKRVAIIGGGPGGLTAAYFLRKSGHEVTIYDSMPKMGGMLRYGIPEYRLPKAILDKEIESIAEMGITFINNIKVGKDIAYEKVKSDYDAVLIAIGAWKSSKLYCTGEDAEGVFGGIDFLREVSMGNTPDIGKNVVVVGGGNTAMDTCRTAVRLGAENVYVVYRRTRAEMPAEDIEYIEAVEEGVHFKFLCTPDEIISENGKVKAVKLQIMELGEPDAGGRRSPVPVEGKFEMLEVDSVIAAIGQKVSISGFEEIELNQKGIISADTSTFRTSVPGVFAIGDATNRGASIAIEAIGEANKAAGVIDSYLKGDMIPYTAPYLSERHPAPDKFSEVPKAERVKMPHRSPEERKHDFKEVNLGLSREDAMKEAARCLECGCHDYDDCKLIRYANMIEGLDPSRLCGEKHDCFKEQRLEVIERDQGKCILCNLCVRICDEVAQKGILGLVDRGFKTVIKPEFNNYEAISCCATCKKCAEACPTGALKIIK